MAIENKIVITCAPRIVPILAKELTSLKYTIVEKDRLSITLFGSFNDCMYLNLHLRTANKVLYHLKSFEAKKPDDLYSQMSEIPWERYIRSNGYVCINGFVKNDFIKDTRFANLKAKDAIVDRIQKLKGRRPDSGPDQSQTMIYLHWKDNQASVYIDTSGETIAKHGYRKTPFKAPMLESLAAACILESNWDRKSPFINPMCGSGTLAIEAALLAINKAPGLMRSNFGFMHINLYNEFEWKKMVKEAQSQVKERPLKIYASDLSSLALKAARANAEIAGVDHLIKFELSDFRKLDLPDEEGVIFMNPEYGLRLGELKELEQTYSEIGDFFKSKGQGYTGYVFTGNLDLAKKIGLKTNRRIELFNAKLDARLLEYELYAGSKKSGKLPS
ncbi:MAG: class I SAM-dependent RNA methyltransferase [Fulvivirga sp.]|uniref:THUMP domain-containing class I SAM-dependent RNA methyltransferase n=1 Tax=Fulvivirga sp. TaxID=1931237 RepID=UPI0032F06F84